MTSSRRRKMLPGNSRMVAAIAIVLGSGLLLVTFTVIPLYILGLIDEYGKAEARAKIEAARAAHAVAYRRAMEVADIDRVYTEREQRSIRSDNLRTRRQSSESNEVAIDRQMKKGECSICMDRLCDAAVVPCGHAAFCYQCLTDDTVKSCPSCRCKIERVIHLYR